MWLGMTEGRGWTNRIIRRGPADETKGAADVDNRVQELLVARNVCCVPGYGDTVK